MFRPTSGCIWNSFRSSGKKHLILTGSRGSGKSTLFSALTADSLPGIKTWAQPGAAVYLRNTATGETAQIGRFEDALPGPDRKMLPCADGFRTLGVTALRQCARSPSPWAAIDEIGYLDAQIPGYCAEILALMEAKRLIAVVRKQPLPFLQALCRREDVFLVDLDQPFGRLGCVIMASGQGKRFGGNKLMADFNGKPLLQWALDASEGLFLQRIVVTRHPPVAQLCTGQGVPVLLHGAPERSDTIRLGLQAITEDVHGCLFLPGDQPLLRRDTLAALALGAVNGKEWIWRVAWETTPGAPVLFPRWAFPELLTLPLGKGGTAVIQRYPGLVRTIPVQDVRELCDIDSPEDLNALRQL